VTDVRIHIVYFVVPLPSMPATAADYRVNVVSFDEITPGRRFDGEQAP